LKSLTNYPDQASLQYTADDVGLSIGKMASTSGQAGHAWHNVSAFTVVERLSICIRY